MYIDFIWIIVGLVIALIVYIRHQKLVKKMQEAYAEQREIANVYLGIAKNNVKPSVFARRLVYYLVHRAEVSDVNVFAILTAWGVTSQTANILSFPGEDDQKSEAEKVAIKQIVDYLELVYASDEDDDE